MAYRVNLDPYRILNNTLNYLQIARIVECFCSPNAFGKLGR